MSRPTMGLLFLLAGCSPTFEPETGVEYREQCNGIDDDGDGVVDEWVGGLTLRMDERGDLHVPSVPQTTLVMVQSTSVRESFRVWATPDDDDRLWPWWQWRLQGPSRADGWYMEETLSGAVRNRVETLTVEGDILSEERHESDELVEWLEYTWDEEGKPLTVEAVVPYDVIREEWTYNQTDEGLVAITTSYSDEGEPTSWITRVYDDERMLMRSHTVSEKGQTPDVRFAYEREGELLTSYRILDGVSDEELYRFDVEWTFDEAGRPLSADLDRVAGGMTSPYATSEWTWTEDGLLLSYVWKSHDEQQRSDIELVRNEEGFITSYDQGWYGAIDRDPGALQQRRVWSGDWDASLGGIRGTLVVETPTEEFELVTEWSFLCEASVP